MNTLFTELPLLPFVNNFGLDLSTTESPIVEIDSEASGEVQSITISHFQPLSRN